MAIAAKLLPIGESRLSVSFKPGTVMRSRDEIRIAQMATAIRVCELHAFSQQMNGVGAVVAEKSDREAFEKIEYLNQVHAT